jgi:hypothetical protein
MDHSSNPTPNRTARSAVEDRLNIIERISARPGWTLATATAEERTLLKLRMAAGHDLTADDLADGQFVRATLAPPRPGRLRLSPLPAPCRYRCCQCRAEGCR